MYNDIYTICQNIEKVMHMFSEELLILDKNTAQYMIDEMQGTINDLTNTVADQKTKIINLNDKIQLFTWLSKQNRLEDLARAAQDNDFCLGLLNEWKPSSK